MEFDIDVQDDQDIQKKFQGIICMSITITSSGKTQKSAPLLGQADPAPFRFIDRRRVSTCLVVADHAGVAVPTCLQGLGLEPEVFQQHIAVDLGSRELATLLAEQLDASLVLANYSRLVVDLNRRLDDPTAFVRESDGVLIPGNQNLCMAQKERRAAAIYHPYHRAIDDLIDGFMAPGHIPVIVSVHSFTPVLGRRRRPWHVGVLWDKDARIARPLLARLRQHPELIIGANEPYSGRHPADYTVDHHGEARGAANVALELRQDLLNDPAGIARWGALLAEALTEILDDETVISGLP